MRGGVGYGKESLGVRVVSHYQRGSCVEFHASLILAPSWRDVFILLVAALMRPAARDAVLARRHNCSRSSRCVCNTDVYGAAREVLSACVLRSLCLR